MSYSTAKKHQIIHQMTCDAAFIAIIILMTFVPYIGFITINPVISFTLIHIPVLVGAALMGWKRGLLYGTVFGLCSCFKALSMPSSFLDFYFVYPWISVLPRMIFGLLSGLVFDLLRKFKKLYVQSIMIGLCSAILTMIHTLLVFLTLFIFGFQGISTSLETNGITWIALLATFCTGGGIEAAVAAVAVPLLTLLLLKLFPRLFGREKEETENENI